MTRRHLKTLARIAAVLAHLFCLGGGVWLLATDGGGFDSDDPLGTGLGLYFIGKSFFVGPMLWIAAELLEDRPEK
jgi:hypothetical protein